MGGTCIWDMGYLRVSVESGCFPLGSSGGMSVGSTEWQEYHEFLTFL